MNEITELDDKYIVLKIDDLDKYIGHSLDRNCFDAICKKILNLRKKEGKNYNKYLVLNLDDKLDFQDIVKQHKDERFIRVNDIAIDLVNAILKAKEKV